MYIGKFHKYKIAAICIAGIQDEHLTYITTAISDSLIAKGYKVLIFNAFTDLYYDSPFTDGEASIYHLLNLELIDVLVVFPETLKNVYVTKQLIKHAHKTNTPVICIDGKYEGCTTIEYNYKDAFEQIVRHVVEEHNCTDTYMMAGLRGNSFSDDRIAAYRKVLEDNGIAFSEDNIGYGDFWSDPARIQIEKLLDSNRELPQAIICANDTMAITVTRCLGDRGIRVPEDIIVTGFDSTYQDRAYSPSDLTSAMVDAKDLADTIANAAEGYMNGTEKPEVKTIRFKMTTAHSCGCTAHSNLYLNEKLLKINDYTAATQANETRISEYSVSSVNCKNLSELSDVILHYMDGCSWICINNDYLSKEKYSENTFLKPYHSVYTDDMTVLVRREWDISEKMISYKASELLPSLGRELKKYNKLLFTPLHFQREIIGYYCASVDYLIYGSNSYHDIRRLTTATNQILEIFKNKYQLQATYNEIQMMHAIDQLTDMYNRRGFFSAVDGMLAGITDKEQILLISIDMDDLKKINDNYGHSEGDSALVVVADAVKAACNQRGICARFGGDEFVLAAPYTDIKHAAAEVLESIQTAIENYNRTSEKPYKISVSAGAKTGKIRTGDELTQLLKKSDSLMYEQKKSKKSSKNPDHNCPEDKRSTINYYEKRIHEIFASDKDATYFYIDYVNFKWYIMSNDDTPECMISDSVNPLRAIHLNEGVFEDDKTIYNEFLIKIKKSYQEKMEDDAFVFNIRIMRDNIPVWHSMYIRLIADSDGRLSELAGSVKISSSDEIMQIEMRNFYSSTQNPLMTNTIIKEELLKNSNLKHAFIQFDIKRFKLINESYGEETGSQLLYHITRQLKLYCNKNQVSVRLNGDIFMVVTPYENTEDIYQIIDEIQKRISNFRNIKYEFVFGVYIVDDPTLEIRLMGDRAGIARTSIKNNAVKNIAFYDQNMLKAAHTRKFIESNMVSALKNQEFIIFLQPKFSISQEKAIGYEALVRWMHPERGIIPPGEFIPLFEENGFITKLDAYVWDCACQVLSDWIERGFEPMPISVNVSRAHLKNDNFIKTLDHLVEKYNIPKKLLELEITESTEGENTLRLTQEVKDHGYILLMDDFGSGYSSLNTLKSTKFDILKIDREFLSSFMNDERGKKIISHTISMSRDVGLDLIAEGVETNEQAIFLSDCGCDIAQGFYYAKPMPVQDAEAYLSLKKTKRKRNAVHS